MSDKPPVLQKFPKFEAFDLEGNVADGYFLAQLIRENPNHIVCLFLAPSTDELDKREPMIIGQVSASRLHEIVEHYPHLKTKYSHAVLCIWKPSISTIHAFVARSLRWCLTSGHEEGGEALRTLKEVAPYTRIVVTTPSKIFDGQFPHTDSSILGLVRHIMIWGSQQEEEDMPFSDGW
ncbi:MAG: hypothetical protein J0L70_18185 [Leptolyngbya sp. UWPOB_LEPTO1]|uniref:hypothetical protein n=1 Tax=Leptolyngbya sp. UWPOB_LEPTO1 TaxID=2815653 RepID=UPI001ACDD186|nr:hypothetical protein [Leptolyngbya sp. UWPOB_LEPTO1]MBN8562464.1 hypothetical protein [Leptolyngbya sp. UWPOB_LEPTO1]